MYSYAIRRLLGALPTLLIVSTIAFFMMRVAPGGPFDLERALPPEVAKNVMAAYKLDDPLWKQYFDYLFGVLQGDLGTIAALHQNSGIDYAVMTTAMTGITIPNFVVAPLLTLVFGVYLSWLPVAGWGRGWDQAVLPIVALALPQVAYVARLTRGSMIKVLRSNYIRTARAKGLPERLTITRHAMKKGAMLPVVSYLGPGAAALLTGSVVIETIFGIPGVGRYFVQAALNRDYTLVMGTVIVYGSMIIMLNLLVDLAYGLLDPKVRYH